MDKAYQRFHLLLAKAFLQIYVFILLSTKDDILTTNSCSLKNPYWLNVKLCFFPTNLSRWSWCSWTLRRVGSTWPTSHLPSTGAPTSTTSWLSIAQTQSLFFNSNSCLNRAQPDLVPINLNIHLKVVFLQSACDEYWLLHVSWAQERKQALLPNEPICCSSRQRANNLGLKSRPSDLTIP